MPPRARWRGGRGSGSQAAQVRGLTEPAVLLLLHSGASYGYELCVALTELGFREYPVDPSTVYRTLAGLERDGLVASAVDSSASLGPPRRVYSITASGEAYLHAWMADLRRTDQVLHCLLQEYDRRFPH